MKIFKTKEAAFKSYNEKEVVYLNGLCPYLDSTSIKDISDRLCGSWCSLFYFDKGGNLSTSPLVILGCKAGEKYLFIEKLMEE